MPTDAQPTETGLVKDRATLYGMLIESEGDIPELVGGAQNYA
jgi:hypothetical protein